MHRIAIPRRGPALFLATALLALSLAGCSGQDAPEGLILAEGGQASFGLLYIAEGEGYFRDEGLAVTFQRHQSGRDAIAAVVAGQADVGTPFDTPVVINIQQGRAIRVLSTLAVGYGNNAVVARADRGVEQPADLRGKRIATVPNASADYLLALVLASAGVPADAVERVPLTPPAAAEALVQGSVDAAAIWAPHTLRAAHALGDATARVFTSPLYLEAVTLSTVEPVLAARWSALKRLLRALVRAESLAVREPERALGHVTAALAGQRPEDVRTAWQTLQPQVRLDNTLLTTLTGELAWYAGTLGDAAPPPPTDLRPYLATALLREVRPQAVTLRPPP